MIWTLSSLLLEYTIVTFHFFPLKIHIHLALLASWSEFSADLHATGYHLQTHKSGRGPSGYITAWLNAGVTAYGTLKQFTKRAQRPVYQLRRATRHCCLRWKIRIILSFGYCLVSPLEQSMYEDSSGRKNQDYAAKERERERNKTARHFGHDFTYLNSLHIAVEHCF